MDNLGELVPKLVQIKELYQMEEFKVLAQFLASLKLDLYKQLLSVQNVKDSSEDVAVLIAQSNLVGTILDLPLVVSELEKGIENRKKGLAQAARYNED
jgi:hypothetical protein